MQVSPNATRSLHEAVRHLTKFLNFPVTVSAVMGGTAVFGKFRDGELDERVMMEYGPFQQFMAEKMHPLLRNAERIDAMFSQLMPQYDA